MKTVVSQAVWIRTVVCFMLCACCQWLAPQALAQTNSWAASASGKWEDSYWSLGELPGTNQTILFINAGSKTLTIGSNTVQNFPDTLNVYSVTVASLPDSTNTLQLDHMGIQTPLTVQSLTVDVGSRMAMDFSALRLDGPNGVGMQVGGEFDQSNSLVSGNQVNVGYIGPGIYTMNGGAFEISHLWVGASYGGVFQQNGGTNSTGITHIEGGEYDFNDGYFGATIYFTANGTFRQRGGVLDAPVSITYGNYFLEAGINKGGISFPYLGQSQIGDGTAAQSGGTNFGGINLGGFYGGGNYTMSNGVSYGGISVGGHASFTLLGGSQLCETQGVLVGEDVEFEKFGGAHFFWGSFTQSGGLLSCSGMTIYGNCYQWGGTALVSGTLNVSGTQSQFISGGSLCASNLIINSIYPASLSGMTVITNEIDILGGAISVGSGDLTVSNIIVNSGAFRFFGNSLNQSGVLALAGSDLTVSSAGSIYFGPLRLDSGGNSLGFYPGPCVVRFRDSSSLAWTNSAIWKIANWAGSLYGGGPQQVIFGTDAAALTTQQLSQIQFLNPAGLAPGNYPARILATGEIVPDSGSQLQPMMNLNGSSNGVMHLMIGGEIGRSYAIEVSTDLVHWTSWATQFNTGGTMTLDDDDSTNCPQRFYRAHLMP